MQHYNYAGSAANFYSFINDLRLKNKNKWFSVSAILESDNLQHVQIKNYNTYLQIFKVDGLEQCAPMDMKAKQWQETIKKGLKI